jgi:hypothetical protein
VKTYLQLLPAGVGASPPALTLDQVHHRAMALVEPDVPGRSRPSASSGTQPGVGEYRNVPTCG